MPSLSDAIRAAYYGPEPFGIFTVDTTSPFAVFLNGSASSVPGLKIVGLSYSVGTTGLALIRQGQLPLCIPTEA